MGATRCGFSEEQLATILKEQEVGMATAGVCRRHWYQLCDVLQVENVRDAYRTIWKSSQRSLFGIKFGFGAS